MGAAVTGGGGLDLGIPGLTGFVEIGAGGFASVYAAHEPDAGRHVAVKVLRAVDERARHRFDRERRNLGMMTEHTNIVTMFRSGFTEHGDHPYLVMEYMPGGSLQDRVDRNDRPPVEMAIELIAEIADAIDFAHGAGILHKDVKPANILLSRTGVAKLTDFGISAVLDATGTSQMGFSLAYASPETFHATTTPDGRLIDGRDERSDLFSLGATLYALVAGGPPFPAETQAMVMHRILTDQPSPTGMPELDRFLTTALAKDPAERFPTAAQFASSLRAVTSGAGGVGGASVLSPTPPPIHGVTEPSPTRLGGTGQTRLLADPDPTIPMPTPTPPRGPRRRRTGFLTVAAAALVAALGVGGLVLSGIFDDDLDPGDATATGPVDSFDSQSQADTDTDTDVDVEPDVQTESTIERSIEVSADSADSDDLAGSTSSTSPEGDSEATTVVAAQNDADDTDDDSSTTVTTAVVASPALAAQPTVVEVLSRSSRTNSVDELPDGRFVSVDFSTGVRVWDRSAPGQDVGVYRGHGAGASVAIVLDGGLVVSGGTYGAGEVHVWDPNDPSTTIGTYTGHDRAPAITALTQLANGHVASGDANGDVRVWNPEDPARTLARYQGHASVIITKIIQLDSGLLLSNGEGDGGHVWDPDSPAATRTVYTAPGSGIEAYTYDVIELDGGLIASDTGGGAVHVWSPGRPSDPVATFTGHGDVGALLALPGGLIASGGENGQIYVWDPSDPSTTLQTYGAHQGTVVSLVDLGNGVVASTASNEVHLWSPYGTGR